jgi:DNA-binding CsgD family transcriptional regulator
MLVDFAKSQLPNLIGQVGTRNFIPGLMGAANRAIAPVDVFSLFHYDAATQPVHFGTASCVSDEATRRTAERYVSGLGLHDPMRLSLESMAFGDAPTTFYLHRDRIGHSAYREQCFVRTGTLERMSVICHDDASWYSINFYRTQQSSPFHANELAAFSEVAQLLSSLVIKHFMLTGEAAASPPETPKARFTRRLRDRAPDLSDRECEICALVLQGHTSESIALQLHVSPNTVLTYRKRAYRKLNIGSQNELFRICLD